MHAYVHDRIMSTLGLPDNWEIDEEALVQHAAKVRGATFQRYEDLYRLGQAQIQGAGESGRPVDPRWAELCLRVLREQSTLYRLSRPPVYSEDEAELRGGADPAEHVLNTLMEIVSRREETGEKL